VGNEFWYRTYLRRNAGRTLAVCAGLLLVGSLFTVWLTIRTQRHSGTLASFAARPNNAPVGISPRPPRLEVASVVEHGRILEVKGVSDPGAIVMINGEPAAVVFPGNSFRHFLGPLPSGTIVITITSQNDQGGVNTKQIAFNVH
jgi:hypothetical protein